MFIGFPARLIPGPLVLMLGAALLAGCSQAQFVVHTAKEVKNAAAAAVAPSAPGQGSGATAPSAGRYKVGSPYQIKGVWYYPKVDYGYVETGIASWYGPNFHNKPTANGETFDQNAVTAAHRTLPLPSVVRVTNLENGRALVLRINDRGPFAHGRIIDLSRRSAQLLGMERQGTAKVRVEILADESRRIAEAYKQGRPVTLAALRAETASAPVPAAAPSVSVSKGAVAKIPGAAIAAPPASAPVTAAPVISAPVTGVPVTPAPIAKTPSASAPAQEAGESAVTLARQSRRTETIIQTEPEKTEIFIQAGAFTDATNADRVTRILSTVGPVRIAPKLVGGKYFYRVRLGPLGTVEDADRALEAVIARGYPGARVIVE